MKKNKTRRKGIEDLKSRRKFLRWPPEVRIIIHNRIGKTILTPEKFVSKVQKNNEAINEPANK